MKATPAARVQSHFRVRYDTVDRGGKITLRHQSGCCTSAWARASRVSQKVVLLVADRDVRVVTIEGELLRHLVLDPSRDYQRQSA